MRLTRRSLLAGTFACAAAPALAKRPVGQGGPVAIDVKASPIAHFSIFERERVQFGALTFRSGLELRSSFEGFGGLSGLSRSKDGKTLVALSDAAEWLTADLVYEKEVLAGLANAVMAPALNENGVPLSKTRSFDTESLTINDGVAYVGIERVHEVRRFEWGRDGVLARGVTVPVPQEAKQLPRNKSLEAIGVAPKDSPLQGGLVAIAERARWGDEEPTRGFILTGPRKGLFDLTRPGDFEITDLAFLPSGDMLVLERRFKILRGLYARIRRIKGDTIRPGALLDGEVLFEANPTHQIDNMEGLGLHVSADGQMVVSLISDDNFSMFQRTLLLEFTLPRPY